MAAGGESSGGEPPEPAKIDVAGNMKSGDAGSDADHSKSALESTLDDLGGRLAPGRRPAGDEGPERDALFRAEERSLAASAQRQGIFGGSLIPESPDDGKEHRVAFVESRMRYLKATHPGTYGGYMGLGCELDSRTHRYVERPLVLHATPREYLDRLMLANEVFNDDICLNAVITGPGGLSVQTSQSAIKGRPATPEEISREMEELGFREIHPDGVYYREVDHVLVWDLIGNVFIAEACNSFAPIDAMIQRASRELVERIRAEIR